MGQAVGANPVSFVVPCHRVIRKAGWDTHGLPVERSLEKEAPHGRWTFYEGPPTANGRPGVHHVISRTIKDLICRYKTMTGHRVERKAGWDTHGLPVELAVEKAMPVLVKHPIQAGLSAPFFVVVELFKIVGLRDDLFNEVQAVEWLVYIFGFAGILVLFSGLTLMLIINGQALRK
mgnify:CR=1 FL=1